MTDILSIPKNTSRKPYIYKVTSFETGAYYIGSQCSGKIVGVNYFTSSTNKEFKNGFKTYREEKYKIEIIKEFEDPEECVHVENYIIRNYMQKKDGLCLNRFYCCSNKKIFSRLGVHHSEETKRKMSISLKGHPSLKGRPSWNKGRHLSEETKQKMSTSLKGHPGWNKDTHHSEEAKQKMRKPKKGHQAWNKGLHLPEETKQKMSEAKKNRIKISFQGEVFDSITEAARSYNVTDSTMSRWVKNKKFNAFYL